MFMCSTDAASYRLSTNRRRTIREQRDLEVSDRKHRRLARFCFLKKVFFLSYVGSYIHSFYVCVMVGLFCSEDLFCSVVVAFCSVFVGFRFCSIVFVLSSVFCSEVVVFVRC